MSYRTSELSTTGSIGNIFKEYADIAKEAAKQSGFNITVTDDATDVGGRPLPHLIHLTTAHPSKDHGAFWAKYQKLGGK